LELCALFWPGKG